MQCILFIIAKRPLNSTLFPYTTLFRSRPDNAPRQSKAGGTRREEGPEEGAEGNGGGTAEEGPEGSQGNTPELQSPVQPECRLQREQEGTRKEERRSKKHRKRLVTVGEK